MRHHVTGYWFLDPAPGWQPPAGLAEFIAAGQPPICIGFGSMHDHEAARPPNIVMKALEGSEQRAVVLTGWGGLRALPKSDRVFFSDAVPHAWLFPRAAAV